MYIFFNFGLFLLLVFMISFGLNGNFMICGIRKFSCIVGGEVVYLGVWLW